MSRKIDRTSPRDAVTLLGASIADRSLKLTRQRRVIWEALLAAGGHLSAEELLRRARGRDPRISTATVYRTLKLLADCGLARAQQFEGGRTVYERLAGREHHDHLVCTRCGAVVEFEDERIEELQLSAARAHGFLVTDHRLELYGLCRRCQPRRGGSA